MAARKDTPPPVIGKIGRYTVFVTPKTTTAPSPSQSPNNSPKLTPSPSPRFGPALSPSPTPKSSPLMPLSPSSRAPFSLPSKPPLSPPSKAPFSPPSKAPLSPPSKVTLSPPSKAPPIEVPPKQFDSKPARGSSGSVLGFFWDALAKVQNAHASLDEYLADWFGLDQSKYQWALNNYYESKGVEKDGKQREITTKGQTV